MPNLSPLRCFLLVFFGGVVLVVLVVVVLVVTGVKQNQLQLNLDWSLSIYIRKKIFHQIQIKKFGPSNLAEYKYKQVQDCTTEAIEKYSECLYVYLYA